jgi:hypothetical protein
MAIAVQSGSPTTPTVDTGAGGTTTQSLTNATNGCGVIVLFGIYNAPSTATVITADVGGETMTAAGALMNWSSQQLQIFYLGSLAGSTGTKTVTITPNNASFYYTMCCIALDKPIELDSTNRTTSSDTISITASVANTFGVSIASDGNATPAVDTGNGFTAIAMGDPATYTQAQYKADMGASGSKTFTQTGAAFQSIYAALFKEASGGGGDVLMAQICM